MPAIIEEIDSTAAAAHYLGKAWDELGKDPEQFLKAAFNEVASKSSFLDGPGARARVDRVVGSVLPPAVQPEPEAEPAQAPAADLPAPAAAPAEEVRIALESGLCEPVGCGTWRAGGKGPEPSRPRRRAGGNGG